MIGASECIINYAAIEHNIKRIKTLAPQSKILAIIKADAYGHGQQGVADHLDQADALALLDAEQAKKLRENGISKPIVLIYGPRDTKQMQIAIDTQCDIVLHQAYQLDLLKQLSTHDKVRIWLKIDTGMHRLGFEPEQVTTIIRALEKIPGVQDIILMSHLATAEVPNCQLCQQQIKLFEQICTNLPYSKSLLNSAGIIAYPDHQYDWVRPGLLLYGASPLAKINAQTLGLKSAMHVRAQITSIKKVKQGERIGYGGTLIHDRDRLVATVAMGYSEGYPRHADHLTPVMVRDTICHLIGRVSMNMLNIDISDCTNCEIGDWVTLWGENLAIETVAQHSQSIAHEIMCQMSQHGLQRKVHEKTCNKYAR